MGSLGVKNLFESQDGLVKGIGELLKNWRYYLKQDIIYYIKNYQISKIN